MNIKMLHSLHKVWLHVIFSTKNREPLIHKNVEQKIYDFIKKELNDMDCSVRAINGMPEHLHILFLLNPTKSYADVIKQIKGSSSHWINEQNIIREKFAWQTGYASYSVSESVSDKVYQYILNQKKHHETKTFIQEYEEFMKLYKIENGLNCQKTGINIFLKMKLLNSKINHQKKNILKDYEGSLFGTM